MAAAAGLLSAFATGESRAQHAPLHRVTDINVGLDEGSSGAGHFVGAGTTTFFGAVDLRGAGGLWRTDGSEAGTTQVGFYPSGFGAGNGPWAALGDAVVVPLQPSQYPGADALWVSDGDGVHGYELWKTDGTSDGTSLVRDTVPGGDSVPANIETLMTAVGDRLVFTVCDDHGCEPWVSDGTTAGTRLLMDVYPGPIGSNPQLIGWTDSLVLLAADGATTGRELWALRVDAVDDPPILLGDLDGDGNFTPLDLALFAGAYGQQGGDAGFLLAADLNGDGAVTPQDQQLWVATHGDGTVPIPVFPLVTPSTRGAP